MAQEPGQAVSQAQLAAAAQARNTNPNFPTSWWPEMSQRPDSWFRSDEAATIATHVLSWQDEVGGWPLMNTTNESFTGDMSRVGPWGKRAALIGATVNEIRFLTRMYNVNGDARYKAAALEGVQFILDAQYPSGGWPHSFPLRPDDYSYYATYNDDMMPDLMTLLREVADEPAYAALGSDVQRKADEAYDRGLDFVLKSQIVVDGELTAWAQQYDPVNYTPMAARTFEPVAISGAESASVLHMLMDIEDPSPEVIRAIEGAVAWYRRSQIDGYELVRADGDRTLVANPEAGPLWARFYQINTNRPIFSGRDSIIRYDMAEIEKERRGGYAWYNSSGTGVFRAYDAWRQRVGR